MAAGNKPLNNKRQWKRYTVKHGAMALAVKPPSLLKKKPVHVRLGPIKDIGMKGLAVQYVDSKNILKKVDKLCIMVPGKGVIVENIPFSVVKDFNVAELPDCKKIKTLCVAFQNMSPVQKVQLENFINEYGDQLVR